MNKHAALNLKAEKIAGGVATDQRHDSAHKHVSGQAVYIDDMPEPAGTLHGCLGLSSVAHGSITSIDLSAVRAAPGVVDVLAAKDVPGENDISPTGRHDEPVLADGKVEFHGQPIFCVIAETRDGRRIGAVVAPERVTTRIHLVVAETVSCLVAETPLSRFCRRRSPLRAVDPDGAMVRAIGSAFRSHAPAQVCHFDADGHVRPAPLREGM